MTNLEIKITNSLNSFLNERKINKKKRAMIMHETEIYFNNLINILN